MPKTNGNPAERCGATTSKGKPCSAHALPDSEYCLFHSPAHASTTAAARQRGGKNHARRPIPIPLPNVDLSTSRGLCAVVGLLIQEAWTLQPSLNRARALAHLIRLQDEMISSAVHEATFRALNPKDITPPPNP